MLTRDLAIAQELKRRVREVAEIVEFKVFGSRARGDDDEYSDMDVFIEVKSLNKEIKDNILEQAWQVGFDNYMVISPLLYTKAEIENSPLGSSPIVKNIAREGVAV